MPRRTLLLLSPLLVALAALCFVRQHLRPAPVLAAAPHGRRTVEVAGSSAGRERGARERRVPMTPAIFDPVGTAQAVVPEPQPQAAAQHAPEAARALVLDAETGRPIAGARVEWRQGDRGAAGTTDAAGAAPLALDLLEATVELRVTSAEYVPFERSLRVARELRVALFAPGRLRGRVLAAETAVPVAGARITARSPGVLLETESAANGSYALDGVPRDALLRLEVCAADFPAQDFRFLLRPGANERRRDLELRHGVRFQGRVVDLDTAAPIAGATLECTWASAEARTAGAQGEFDVEVLRSARSQTRRIRVSAPDYCALLVELPEGSDSDTLLPLVRPGWIEGVVRSADGAAIASADVTLVGLRQAGVVAPGEACSARGAYETPDFTPVATDAQGAFRSGPIPRVRDRAGAQVRLRVEASGFTPATESVRIPATGEVVRVEVQLDPAPVHARARGTVLLNGVPCPGSLVWRAGGARGRVSAPHGEFLVEELPPGPSTWDFVPLDRPARAVERVAGLRREVDLTAGAEVRVDYDLVSPLGAIHGTVATLSGTPLPGERVVAELGSGSFATTSDASGTYWLEVPDLGEPYALVCRPGAQQERRTGVAPGSVVDFVLPVYSDVRVRARDARTRAPIGDLRLAWSSAGDDGAPRSARVRGPDTEGWWLASLPIGRIALRAEARGFLPAGVEDVEVLPSGATADLVLDLPRWSSVELVLEDDCPPLPDGHFVFLVEEPFWEGLRFEPRPGGPVPTLDGRDEELAARRAVDFGRRRRTRVSGLGEGRLRFKQLPNDIVIEPDGIELPLAEPGPVRLRWSWRGRAGSR